jgi:CspA family cold shock protein
VGINAILTEEKKTGVYIMPQGKIKWFSADKGYGFIEQENGSDLFVHANDVQEGALQEGDNVEFEIGEGKKGPCAKDVRTF